MVDCFAQQVSPFTPQFLLKNTGYGYKHWPVKSAIFSSETVESIHQQNSVDEVRLFLVICKPNLPPVSGAVDIKPRHKKEPAFCMMQFSISTCKFATRPDKNQYNEKAEP